MDYVAYLLETETDEERQQALMAPQLIGQQLIDSFIENDKGKIVLNQNPVLKPEVEPESEESAEKTENNVFTETLARIYIKQGNYLRALEIIKQLNLDFPKKSAYFADQIRFLEKLIINNNKNKA